MPFGPRLGTQVGVEAAVAAKVAENETKRLGRMEQVAEIGLNYPHLNVLGRSLNECWPQSEYSNTIRRYLATSSEEPCSCRLHLERCRWDCLAQKVIEQESVEGGDIVKRADPLCLRNLISVVMQLS